MSKTGKEFIAQTEGTEFTMYAVMRRLGITLSKEQAEFQAYLESKYPKFVTETQVPSINEDEGER